MKNLRYLALSALLVGGLYSCKKDAIRETDQDHPPVVIPEVPVDYTKYVAIGNSLTFGYADGATYKEAQENSYPLILSKSLNTDFKQALLNDGGGTGYMYLAGFDPATKLPIIKKATPSDDLSSKHTGDLNNFGVPGIRNVDMGLPGYGAVNPYMGRLVENTELAKTKYVDLVGNAVSDATFVTFWLGNNDVLGYASTGGKYGVDGEKSPAYRLNGLPDASIFTANYKFMSDLVTDKRAILVNVPPVSSAPFFTTVGPQIFGGIMADPNNPYILDASSAAVLNQVYKLAGYEAEDDIFFREGQNFPLYLVGPEGGQTVKQLDVDMQGDDDFVVLKFSSEIPKLKKEGLGFVNVFGYPNEMEYIKQSAVYKAIDDELKQIQPLLDAKKLTEEQAAKLKGGLKMLGLTDAQIDAMTLSQIAAVLNNEKAKAMSALAAAAQKAGLDPTKPASLVTASKRLANPIATEWVLDQGEAELVRDKTREINSIIKTIADSNPNWILLDAHNIMLNDILHKNNDYGFTADYIAGSFFSLDGIHLTPKGYAYIALKMVQEMNKEWEQNLTEPNVKDYRGIKMSE